jgi:hypothetical protein
LEASASTAAFAPLIVVHNGSKIVGVECVPDRISQYRWSFWTSRLNVTSSRAGNDNLLSSDGKRVAHNAKLALGANGRRARDGHPSLNL